MFMARVVPFSARMWNGSVVGSRRTLVKAVLTVMLVSEVIRNQPSRQCATRLCRARAGTGAVAEKSFHGDSCANGVVERAVHSVEEMIRVQKLALETRLETRLSVTCLPCP